MCFHLVRGFRKLSRFLRRAQFERELAEEMETHRSLLRDGMRMGNVTLAKEESREMWGWQGFDRIGQDLRYAWRGLLRNPAFAVTALVSLALGIGANSANFAAVSAIFLQPLAVHDPAALVTFSATDARGRITSAFPASFGRLLRSSNAFADVIGVMGDGLSFEAGDRAERIMGEAVTPNFFPALGVSTVLGKGFSRDVRDGEMGGRGGAFVWVLEKPVWWQSEHHWTGHPAEYLSVCRDRRVGCQLS